MAGTENLAVLRTAGLMFWYRHRATSHPGEATGSRRAALSLLQPVFDADPGALPAEVAGFLASPAGEFAWLAGRAAELKRRYESGDRQALDEAIDAGLSALGYVIEDDLELPRLWFDLGAALMRRYFARGDDTSDAQVAAEVFRRAESASRDEDERLSATAYRAAIHLELYTATGNLDDLAHAVETFSLVHAAGAATAADRAEFGQALVQWFEAGGELSDVDTAVALLTEVQDSAELDDGRRDEVLRWRTAAYAARFAETGDPADLAETMRLIHHGSRYDEAVDPPPHDVLRFVAIGILDRLPAAPPSTSGPDRVAIFLRAALRAAPGHDESLAELLGAVLLQRYADTGHPAQLERARRLLRDDAPAALSEDWAQPLLREALVRTSQPGTDLATYEWSARIARFLCAVMPADWSYRELANVSLADDLRKVYQAYGRREDLDEAIEASRHWSRDSDPEAAGVSQLAVLLSLRAKHTGRADLDEAASLLAAAPDTGVVRSALAGVLLQRWQLDKEPDDAREALALLRRVVAETPEDDRNRLARLTNLATALEADYEVSGDGARLDEAIELYRKAVAATPANTPSHGIREHGLALALKRRGHDRDDEAATAEAVTLLRRIADDGAPALRAEAFDSLIDALAVAQDRTGDPELLTELVDRLRERIADPADEETQRKRWSVLGSALSRRYRRLGDPADLDAAVDALRAAATPGDPEVLDELGVALRVRCERTGLAADADAAVEAHRAALEATEAASPDRPGRLAALGLTLCSRFEVTHVRQDVDDALGLLRQAVAAHPDEGTLSDLGVVLMRRFGVTDDQAELDEAIALQRRAVAAAGTGHPDLSRRLVNLAGPLRLRYERFGRLADLDEAIAAERVVAADESYPAGERPEVLADLGISLWVRAQRTGSGADLDEAEAALRDGLGALPEGHVLRPKVLSGLAAAFLVRARESAPPDLALLGEAIELAETAVRTGSPAHYQYQDWQGRLAAALATRYQLTGDPQDGARAIGILRTLLDGAEIGADRSHWLVNLGHCLAETADEDEESYTAASAAYREVATSETTPADLRCDAARWWGRLAGRRADWATAVAAYATAIELLPLAVARGLHRSDQEFKLRRFAGLGPDAAACAIRAGDPGRALELLEQGRGVLLAQAFETRDEIGDLQRREPELARRFVDLRTQLDAQPGGLGSDRLHRLAEECNAVVAEIRALPGHERFLRPPGTGDVLRAVPDGAAAVVLNASRFGFDALIVRGGRLALVPLSDVDDGILAGRAAELGAAIRSFHDPTTGYGARVSIVDSVVEFLGWLWDTVAEPVLREAGPGAPPLRLWWVPTGPFVQLPLHAAGRHDEPGQSVLDRAVSSYALTLRSLVRGEGPGVPPGEENALVVTATAVPGHPRLTAGEAEAAVAAAHLRGARVVPEATPAAVSAALGTATHVHFACHATADLDDPSSSHLVLHEGTLSITDIAARHSSSAYFAYLSACDTFRTSADLADEAIHLSSAFQLAGFRHVIAALWPISDATAAEIAGRVYEGLAAGPAVALHEAVRALREDDPGDVVNWVAPIHSGA
ncbi:CHAT domain-containing protein [Amycolatopsis sp. NEAU-NG30]|uniref:CHAT domain-containing protein n=1 Tax=Amycolatopsis melonis TaxID=3156488 RepID=A0ABV0LBX6_9PSEU